MAVACLNEVGMLVNNDNMDLNLSKLKLYFIQLVSSITLSQCMGCGSQRECLNHGPYICDCGVLNTVSPFLEGVFIFLCLVVFLMHIRCGLAYKYSHLGSPLTVGELWLATHCWCHLRSTLYLVSFDSLVWSWVQSLFRHNPIQIFSIFKWISFSQ